MLQREEHSFESCCLRLLDSWLESIGCGIQILNGKQSMINFNKRANQIFLTLLGTNLWAIGIYTCQQDFTFLTLRTICQAINIQIAKFSYKDRRAPLCYPFRRHDHTKYVSRCSSFVSRESWVAIHALSRPRCCLVLPYWAKRAWTSIGPRRSWGARK